MDRTIERPDFVTDDMLEYLDELRASSVVNMFRAGPYVEDTFWLTSTEARAVLTYWMKTFDERNAAA